MNEKALRLIQPVSKRDQVVSSFKEAILRGDIQPGEPIVESKVAQQLGAGIPLIREALIELRSRGLATGVVSNFDQRLRPLLAALDVHHLFHAVVLPADVGAAKPDRAIFDAALKRLGLGGEDVAYVGDRAEQDVAASRAAGLRAVDVAALATLHELPRALGIAKGPEGS